MKLTLKTIGTTLASSAEGQANQEHLAELETALLDKRRVVAAGWGAKYAHRKGKMTTAERIEALIDREYLERDPGSAATYRYLA